MGTASTGLYLGTEHADVVSLSGSFRNPRLIHQARTPLPADNAWRNLVRADEGQLQADLGLDPQQTQTAVVSTIRSLLATAKLPSARVQTGVASESVVIRYFQMPTIPVHERKMAVSFEAKKYLPFKLEELVTDFRAIVHRSDPNLMRVMFFGIKKASLNAYLSLLESANLIPQCLEPAPVSLMRLARQSGQLPPGKVAAVLFVEQDTATISIARDDLLYLSRNVSIISPSEGDQDASNQLFEALINETRVSIDYYRRRFLGEPGVEKIIFFGKQIDASRTQELAGTSDLPVEMGEPFRRISGAHNLPSNLAVAVGLALRGLERGKAEPNLLPLKQAVSAQEILKPMLVQAGIGLLVLGLWSGATTLDLNRWQRKIQTERTGQIHPVGISSQSPPTALLKHRQDALKEKRFIQTVRRRASKPSWVLSELSKLLPEEAWLAQIRLEENLLPPRKGEKFPEDYGRMVHLAGYTFAQNSDKELEQINAFLDSLRKNPLFKTAFAEFSLDSAQRANYQEQEATRFKMSLRSDRFVSRSKRKGKRR